MFDRIIKDRRAHPRDDLATLLASTTLPGGEPMGALETFGYYLIVFTAGHDTTRNALAGALAAFVEHPDELRKVARRPRAHEARRSKRSSAGRRRSTT